MGIGIGLFWLIVAIVVAYLIYKLIKSERSLHQAGQSSEALRIFCLKGTPRESWSLMDGRVEEFLKRPIEHSIPYLFVDASYSKVRTDSRYITKAFVIVTAVGDDGYRDILGARIADGEDELFWTGFFDALKDRGYLEKSLLCPSDL